MLYFASSVLTFSYWLQNICSNPSNLSTNQDLQREQKLSVLKFMLNCPQNQTCKANY